MAPLFGFLILSDASYERLKGFFRWRSFELDRASGFELNLIDVGNPAVCGEFYKLARAQCDAEAAQSFADEIPPAELEDTYRLKVMRKLATMLAVSPGEWPCIVFAGAGKFETIATFRIEPAWYSTPDARSLFGNALKDWIANLELNATEALAGPLESELSQLRRRLDTAFEALPRVEDRDL